MYSLFENQFTWLISLLFVDNYASFDAWGTQGTSMS
jgi:hypothetical protein